MLVCKGYGMLASWGKGSVGRLSSPVVGVSVQEWGEAILLTGVYSRQEDTGRSRIKSSKGHPWPPDLPGSDVLWCLVNLVLGVTIAPPPIMGEGLQPTGTTL